jgi:hypothetical protein
MRSDTLLFGKVEIAVSSNCLAIVGAILGPLVAGVLQQIYQSPTPMFTAIGVAAILAGAIVLLAKGSGGEELSTVAMVGESGLAGDLIGSLKRHGCDVRFCSSGTARVRRPPGLAKRPFWRSLCCHEKRRCE